MDPLCANGRSESSGNSEVDAISPEMVPTMIFDNKTELKNNRDGGEQKGIAEAFVLSSISESSSSR